MQTRKNLLYLFLFLGGFLTLPAWVIGQSLTAELTRIPPDQTVTMKPDSVIRVSRSPAHSARYYSIQNHRMVDDPDQIIDLPSVDADQYAWKYEYYQRLVVGGGLGYPLVFGDWNQNGRLDVTGDYKITQDGEMGNVAIMELSSDSLFQLQQVYGDSLITPLASTDMDHDGVPEMNIRRVQHFWNLESSASDVYPDSLQFSHRMWDMSWAVGSETFTDLDGDAWQDLVYVGDDTTLGRGQWICVAEYDSSVGGMIRRMTDQPPEWRVSGIATGDFDQDGVAEFVIGSIYGDVYVYEYTGSNTYVRVFDGSVPTSNAYMNNATPDLDGNGKPEFFIGGSAYYNGQAGTLLTWFEATADNQYQLVRDVLLLGTSVLGTTELYTADLDSDGRDELICAFEEFVVVLQWEMSSQQFTIFYLYRLDEGWADITSVTPVNPYQEHVPDLLISVENFETTPRVKSYWFRSQIPVGVQPETPSQPAQFSLSPPYPNPFNRHTTMEFTVPSRTPVTVQIYDITGHVVHTLVRDRQYAPGTYRLQWDGTNHQGHTVGSGVYFCRFSTLQADQVQKVVLVK